MKLLKKSTPAGVDFDKPVPAPEDVDAELRALIERQSKLVAELQSIDAEQRAISRGEADRRRDDDRVTQIDALIRGSAYEPAADVRDQIARLAKRRRLIDDALHELAIRIRDRRQSASAAIVATFRPEQEALAREFYQYLAAAVAVHARFGEIRQRLERAGVDSSGLHDFGIDLLGVPNKRADHAGFALRDGVKRKYIEASACPTGYA